MGVPKHWRFVGVVRCLSSKKVLGFDRLPGSCTFSGLGCPMEVRGEGQGSGCFAAEARTGEAQALEFQAKNATYPAFAQRCQGPRILNGSLKPPRVAKSSTVPLGFGITSHMYGRCSGVSWSCQKPGAPSERKGRGCNRKVAEKAVAHRKKRQKSR